MGLFSTFFEWQEARMEKKIAEMKAKGVCPDCQGSGLSPLTTSAFYYANIYHCETCNGTGLFTE
mgnify:CR=1 FL=1